MTCFIANLPGGIPEIMPIPIDMMNTLQTDGMQSMMSMLGVKRLSRVSPSVRQYVGAAVKPDATPFYLSVLAPELAASLAGPWQGAFYADFGVGNIVGVIKGDPGAGPITTLSVKTGLLQGTSELVSAEWQITGSQITTPSKAILIGAINIINSGPHNADDMRRCIALHAPQRAFGEPRAIIAMQCGVAAACLIESIC